MCSCVYITRPFGNVQSDNIFNYLPYQATVSYEKQDFAFKEFILIPQYLCTKDVQYQFNNTIYCQIDDLPMGSPLGLIMVDIFMGYLETTVLKQAISETTEQFIYVDGTFVVCNIKQHAISPLKLFSNVDHNIQFTMKHEKDIMLHHLDIAIQRRGDGTVQRSIYRKSTWNGLYLNFSSFCPLSYKKALVKTLFYGVELIYITEKLGEGLMNVEKCLRDRTSGRYL